ncbi:MAG: hypothetical protein J6K48_11850 [Lachnospiraceae bacterium]|nr:hypothetical protein [Lachnospiraceae bacterium]
MEVIPIEKLAMSTRANHVLHRMAIETVDELMATPITIIAEQRNVGAKTVAEIEDTLDKLNTGEICLAELETENMDSSAEVSFSENQLLELSRHSIAELGLSVRAYNVLMRAECMTLDKVAILSEEDLADLKNSGKKTVVDIRQSIGNWLAENMISSMNVEDNEEMAIDREVQEYYQRLASMISPLGQICWRKLYQYAESVGLMERIISGGVDQIFPDNIIAVLEIPNLQESLKTFFLKVAPDGIIRTEELEKNILLQNLEINKDILLEKLCDGTICLEKDGYILLKRRKIVELISDKCSNEQREYGILEKRLAGESLQSIADEFELTRERIRQIARKTVCKFPLLWEDYFKEPFERFRFSKQEFSYAFPLCGEEGYEYLLLRYSKGKEELTEETLKEYDGIFANRLKIYLKEAAIRRDKQTVSRTDMVYRVLISNSDRALSMDDFETAYYEYIDLKGYPRDRLELNVRTVANHLRNAKNIVFNEQNCVRYCDVDYYQIWENIDFNRYKNLVISSDRIFQDYSELMEDLDIRDGYELFYVIKSSLENWINREFDISCRRVPVIIFGKGDEAVQAVHFLREISPVDYFDYYQAYEERYGLHKESAQGNPTISNALSQYYIDGKYVIDVPTIDERDASEFKQMLAKRKIWFIDDLEKIFKEICVHSSEDALNAAAFKRIGYSLNAGYAYDDKYGSVSNLFDTEIFNGNIVDMTQFDRRLTTLSAFGSALDKTKKSLEYIETAPKILMSLECVEQHYGITSEEIKTLQHWVLDSCEEKYFNAHSLWNIIKENSIVQKLQNNEWMCTCVFRQQEEVYSLSVAGGIILAKDSTVLNLSKICEWIVEKEGKMSIQNLTGAFNDTFNTNIPYHKIAEKLKASGSWDVCVTDSFDDYLDTLMIGVEEETDLFQEEFF